MVMARPRIDDERSPSDTGGDRRVVARHSPEDVPWILVVKLSREEARAINVSSRRNLDRMPREAGAGDLYCSSDRGSGRIA